METHVTGRHIEVTPAIRQYAIDKTDKLPRFYDRVTQIEVVIDRGPDNHEFDVELRVYVERRDAFIARATETDLYAGIDAAVDKMERQLTDHKEKLRNRKHQAPR